MDLKKLFLPLTIAIVLIATSCYYDSEEDLYPVLGTACDTTAVTFSGTIVPLLANSCNSCHSNSTAATFGGGIRLEAYADVTADINAFVGSIKQINGYSPMPKNGGKLSDCSILVVDIWVRDGMLDN